MADDKATPHPNTEAAEQLLVAARAGDAPTVESILSCVADTAAKRTLLSAADPLSGNTALHLCSANNHLALLKTLLSLGAPLDACNASGSTPLHYASLIGHFDVVAALLASGASPVIENDFGRTAIDEAHTARKKDVSDALMRFVEGKAEKLPDAQLPTDLLD